MRKTLQMKVSDKHVFSATDVIKWLQSYQKYSKIFISQAHAATKTELRTWFPKNRRHPLFRHQMQWSWTNFFFFMKNTHRESKTILRNTQNIFSLPYSKQFKNEYPEQKTFYLFKVKTKVRMILVLQGKAVWKN